MIHVITHLNLLGMPVRDRVTGFHGVVSSVTFDLYGCIQAIVTPPAENNAKADGHWFEIMANSTVMQRPAFDWSPEAVAAGEKGCGERPRQ